MGRRNDKTQRLSRGDKYWHPITDLGDPQQRAWLARTRPVYLRLFEPEFREPFSNFSKYISGTTSGGESRDFFYTAEWRGNIVGMFFATAYPEHAFVSYSGVDRDVPGLSDFMYAILVDGMFNALNKELIESEVRNGALFELERVSRDDVLRLETHASPRAFAKARARIVNRIRATLNFQNHQDAWEIPYIMYRQPPPGTEREAKEVPMHLIYMPSARVSTAPPRLTKQEVENILRFIYERFYLEGFDESRDYIKGGREQTVAYLKGLVQSVASTYPEEAELTKIRPGVFISYQSHDLDLVSQLAKRLEAGGYDVWYWGKERDKHVGEPLWPVIKRYLDVMPITVFLITRHLRSKQGGQRTELQHVVDNDFVGQRHTRLVCYLTEHSAPVAGLKKEGLVPSSEIYLTFERNQFSGLADSLMASLARLSRRIRLYCYE